ncbi:MAG TPA: hypothetical protein VGN33_07205 [Leifsonia sp.]|jgi:hypothetical protein|nr:hypothetical protein [Leifsonia sp.]
MELLAPLFLHLSQAADTNAPRLTDWITAIAAAATSVVAALALIYARAQINEAAKGRQLTRDLDVERSQPYVVAFMERTASSEQLVDLVIRNYGVTAAKDVHIELDPWPERSTEQPTDPARRVEVPDVIPFLAPGQEWRTLWDLGPSRRASGLPNKHEGSLSYIGVHDISLHSPVILDWSTQKGRRWAIARGMHDAADALVKIEELLRSFREGLDGPLSVYVRDGDAHDIKVAEDWKEWKRDHPDE